MHKLFIKKNIPITNQQNNNNTNNINNIDNIYNKQPKKIHINPTKNINNNTTKATNATNTTNATNMNNKQPKKIHINPTKKIHINPTKKIHINPTKKIHINPTKNINNNTTNTTNMNNNTIIIYILCYNIDTYNFALNHYNKYKWAKPIILNNQDYTFENVFWKQLYEIESEWSNYDMVGVISYKAYKKINIDNINNIIINKLYYPQKYYHFLDSKIDVLNKNKCSHSHPNFEIIWNDMLKILNLENTTESYCNYFMCTPYLMKKFMDWYNNCCLPKIIEHPLSFTDAKYQGSLSENDLINLWGKPYYPLIVFVLERLNKCFFLKELQNNNIDTHSYSKINIPIHKALGAIFLFVPGDNSSGGYRTLLTYINYLVKNNIYIDIYLGNDFNCINTDKNGNSIFKINMNDALKIINSYNEININDYNFYLGLYVRRKYKFLLSNAWQIADAIYHNKHHADKLGYIIQDLEYLFYDESKYKNIIENTYKSDYYYYCLSSYLSIHFKKYSNYIVESKLCIDTHIYFNKNNVREKSIIIAYYKYKKGRLPKLTEKIINILDKNNILCYVFPDNYNSNSNNIKNLGILKPSELNEYYNKCKIGCVFSNSNPSRLGFEMISSGLQVIEYESEFTKYDLPNNIFTKINSEDNIIDIIYKLFNNDYIYDKNYINSIDKKYELEYIYNFIKLLL